MAGKIQIINENGVLKGIDTETGNEVPIDFGDIAPDKIGTADDPAEKVHTKNAAIGDNKRDWGDRIDVFAVGGQSNAEGRAALSNALDVPQGMGVGYDVTNDALERPYSDPLDPSVDKMSAWPAFIRRYYQMTGTPVGIVDAAIGGSAMTPGADDGGSDNWHTDSNLPSTLVTRVNDFQTRLKANGYNPRFRGILWSQGEKDAQGIDNGNTTKSSYKTEFGEMLDYYDSQFSHEWGLWCFETGYPDGGDTTGYQQIREAQRELARDRTQMYYTSGVQKRFPGTKYQRTDNVHYSSEGLNAMGREGARRIAQGLAHPSARSCVIYQTTDQSLTSSYGKLSFGADQKDPLTQADLSNDQIVIEQGGEYDITATMHLTDTSVTSGEAFSAVININGSRAPGANAWNTIGASNYHAVTPTKNGVELSAGDTVSVEGRHTASGSTISGQNFTHLSVSPTRTSPPLDG